jgi:Flp pilus assembly protein TadG
MRRTRRGRRTGTAAAELALLAPFLALLFIGAVDYGRIFYYSITLENCARNGALYASDPVASAESSYTSLTKAAVADAPNLSPAPDVSSASGTDSAGHAYVEVTATYTFKTLTHYPGIPAATTISRTVRMDVAPVTPK